MGYLCVINEHHWNFVDNRIDMTFRARQMIRIEIEVLFVARAYQVMSQPFVHIDGPTWRDADGFYVRRRIC